MATVSEILLSAAIKLGAKEPGGSLTTAESAEALKILISMLASIEADTGLIYRITQDAYTWPANTTTRSIGVGGNLSGVRPDRVRSAFFRDSGGQDYTVRVLYDRAIYDAYITKNIAGDIPDTVFYDPSYPVGVLYVYPKPSAEMTFFVNYEAPLQTFTSGLDVVQMPPGYQWMIENNLAIALESVFSLQAPPSVVLEAMNSKRRLGKNNYRPIYSKTETAAVLNARYGNSLSIYEGG